MALFVVAGLVFTYGLGHAAPMRVCTAHLTSVPADVADAMAHQADLAAATKTAPAAGTTAAPSTTSAGAETAYGVPGKAVTLASAPSSAKAPLDLPPLVPAGGCLSLAILLTFMVLALASGPSRTRGVLPARLGWVIRVPSQRAPFSLSLPSLRVFRL
ncbi:hypothetical protein GCM10010411_84680 [Actinomadura fulvescens]|uniref:Uncharacterized protein n=1 Tax=Actinomadura fulvescens TaxID=46160 RepID=A0ABP6D1E1_9ACTN